VFEVAVIEECWVVGWEAVEMEAVVVVVVGLGAALAVWAWVLWALCSRDSRCWVV